MATLAFIVPLAAACPLLHRLATTQSTGRLSAGQISAIVSDEATRSHVLICPKGHYCFGGVKIPCPKGKYGATEGLSVSNRSGDVDPGY